MADTLDDSSKSGSTEEDELERRAPMRKSTTSEDDGLQGPTPIKAIQRTIRGMRLSLQSGMGLPGDTPPDEEEPANNSINTDVFGELHSDASWTQYQRDAKKLLADANEGRAKDAGHLVQTLQAALQNYRSQNADLMERIKSLTLAAEEHILLHAQQEREKDQLAHELSIARSELANLRSAKNLQKHMDSEALFTSSDALARGESEIQMASLVRERDDAIAKANYLEERLIKKEGSSDILKLQGEIRSLQQELRTTAARSVAENDEELTKNQKTIADLARQLKQANKTIEAFSSAEQTSELQQKRSGRTEDAALLKQLQSAQKEIAELKNIVAASDSTRIAALEAGLEEALNQRDHALAKLRHLPRSSKEASSVIKQLHQASLVVSDLERDNVRLHQLLMFEKEKAYRELQDHRLQRETIKRTHPTVSGSTTIQKLEQIIREKDAKIKELEERNPYRNDRMMQAFMLAKQHELDIYRSANLAFQELAQRISKEPGLNGSLKRAAEITLDQSGTVVADLPQGWEARKTKSGLTYYIDHQRKLSTWIHPKFGTDTIAYDDNDFPVPEYPLASDHSVGATSTTSQVHSTSTTESTTAHHQQLLKSIRAVQARIKT